MLKLLIKCWRLFVCPFQLHVVCYIYYLVQVYTYTVIKAIIKHNFSKNNLPILKIYCDCIVCIHTCIFMSIFLVHTVAVIINDEGSKNLTAHSIYNTTLRMIKTNDILQDLAADGRLFSMYQEMTSHQLSHLRRMVKTVLNAKLIMR